MVAAFSTTNQRVSTLLVRIAMNDLDVYFSPYLLPWAKGEKIMIKSFTFSAANYSQTPRVIEAGAKPTSWKRPA